MSSESTTHPPDTHAVRRGQARYLAALTASAAAVLTACLLLVPLNGAESAIWTVLGTLALGLLLAATVLCVGASVAAPTDVERQAPRHARLLFLGALAAVAGLVMVVGMVAARLFVPTPAQTVTVQFSDPTGRVIVEYCPTLPGSFEAESRPADLSGTSATVPVRVTSDVCGNPEFDRGVWLYLQRSGITIGVADR